MPDFVAFDSPLYPRLAMTLAHFLWQGLAIAVCAFAIARCLRRSSAQHRYGVYLTALASMVACLPGTFFLVSRAGSQAVVVDFMTDHVEASSSSPTLVFSGQNIPVARSEGSRGAIVTTNSAVTHSAGTADAVSHENTPRYLTLRGMAPCVMALYFLVVAAMLLRLSISLYGGYRLRCDARPIDGELLAAATRAATRIGLSDLPTIAFCNRVAGPVVLGLLRPIILLPVAFTAGLTPQQIDAILAHELAHIRRFDHLLLVAQRLAEALLFFHPAVWYVSRCMTIERENCCDDAVVEAGSPRQAYAELLLQIAEQRVLGASPTAALAASGNNISRLRQRVTRLLNAPAEPIVRLSRAGALAMVCCPLAVIVLLAVPHFYEQPTLQASTPRPGQETTVDSAAKTASGQPSTPRTKQEVAPPNDLFSLRQELQEELARHESQEAIENVAHAFRTRYAQPERLAVAHAAVASRLSEIGDHAGATNWALAALRGPLPPRDRVAMFTVWGASARDRYAEKRTFEAHLHRAVPLLLGLVESQRAKLEDERDGFADQFTRLLVSDRSGGDEITAYFRKFPHATFVPDELPRPPRATWIPADVTFHGSLRIDFAQLFESLPPLVNAVAGDRIFADVLESILRDPAGPQFDVRRDLIAHLGDRATVIADFSPLPSGHQRILLACSTVDSAKLTTTLDKAFSIDPQARIRRHGEQIVWEIIGNDENVKQAVAVAHDQLMITHDAELLEKVLSSLPERADNAAVDEPPPPVPAVRPISRDWLAAESRESIAGGAPYLELKRGDTLTRVECTSDATVISYLADRAIGSARQLAVSRNGTNRILLAFPTTQFGDVNSLERAVLHLKQTKSSNPITAPLDLLVFDPTSKWTERATNWDNQPKYRGEPVARLTVRPEEHEIKVDLTSLIRKSSHAKGEEFDLMLTALAPAAGLPSQAAHQLHSAAPPDFPSPPLEHQFERLPWPHQSAVATPVEIARINSEVWIINDNPLYQADRAGNWRYFHGGLDIVLPNGTPIYAMKDGWVRSTERGTVTVADSNGDDACFGWEYTHISEIAVRRGQRVSRGDKLGVVNFRGLEHLHLTKVYSQTPFWGDWTWTCYPNAHFQYTDTKPPVIEQPFYFFRNKTDQLVARSDEGEVVVHGDIDIVVPMYEVGEYAAGGPANVGNRLGITRIEYEIRAADADRGTKFKSFDFTLLRFRKGFSGRSFGTELSRHVYKHWGLFESEQERRKKMNSNLSSYYIITNSPPAAAPTTLSADTSNHCWKTSATTADGQRRFPNGRYIITVRATDFRGHSAESSVAVRVQNEER